MTREVCEHQVPIFEHCNQCETRIYPKGQRVHLSKHELIQLLRLLSALESVMVYQSTSKALLPDYLLDELHTCAEILEREILK